MIERTRGGGEGYDRDRSAGNLLPWTLLRPPGGSGVERSILTYYSGP